MESTQNQSIFVVVEQPGPSPQRTNDLKNKGLKGINGAYIHASFKNKDDAQSYAKKVKKESGDKRNEFYVFEIELK